MGLLMPVAWSQKPPAPAPPPPSKPTQPVAPSLGSSQPMQPDMEGDLVVFLRGRIATSDGTSLPNDTMVERVCNESVRQQVYATPQGDFSMQMESRFDSFLDASGGPAPQEPAAKRLATGGIPRRELMNCEHGPRLLGFVRIASASST